MKTWIESLETTDGYLRSAKIELAEGLTCIIGARGTCKSTIAETIRFVHDHDPKRTGSPTRTEVDPMPAAGASSLLQATLGSGAATCTIRTTDPYGRVSELRLERSIGADRSRIHRDGVLDTSLTTLETPIEIYSQGELVKIAENPHHRLRLIDRPHAREIERIKQHIRAAQDEIARHLCTLWIQAFASRFIAVGDERSTVALLRDLLAGLPFTEIEAKWAHELRFSVSREVAYLTCESLRASMTVMAEQGCDRDDVYGIVAIILCRELHNPGLQQFAVRCALAAISSLLARPSP